MKKSAVEKLKNLFLTAPKPMSVRYMCKQTGIPAKMMDEAINELPFEVVYHFYVEDKRHRAFRRLFGLKPRYIPAYFIDK